MTSCPSRSSSALKETLDLPREDLDILDRLLLSFEKSLTNLSEEARAAFLGDPDAMSR